MARVTSGSSGPCCSSCAQAVSVIEHVDQTLLAQHTDDGAPILPGECDRVHDARRSLIRAVPSEPSSVPMTWLLWGYPRIDGVQTSLGTDWDPCKLLQTTLSNTGTAEWICHFKRRAALISRFRIRKVMQCA